MLIGLAPAAGIAACSMHSDRNPSGKGGTRLGGGGSLSVYISLYIYGSGGSPTAALPSGNGSTGSALGGVGHELIKPR